MAGMKAGIALIAVLIIAALILGPSLLSSYSSDPIGKSSYYGAWVGSAASTGVQDLLAPDYPYFIMSWKPDMLGEVMSFSGNLQTNSKLADGNDVPFAPEQIYMSMAWSCTYKVHIDVAGSQGVYSINDVEGKDWQRTYKLNYFWCNPYRFNGFSAADWDFQHYDTMITSDSRVTKVSTDKTSFTPTPHQDIIIKGAVWGKIHVEMQVNMTYMTVDNWNAYAPQHTFFGAGDKSVWQNVNPDDVIFNGLSKEPVDSQKWILASDEADLRTGVGSVQAPTDPVEENKTATFYVTTGYSHSIDASKTSGWSLDVFNPDGVCVWTKENIPDHVNGYKVDWLVPFGSYKTTWNNAYRVVLTNQLLGQSNPWLCVIGAGMSKLVPGSPSFSITKGGPTFTSGDEIQVELTAKKNPIGYPIESFNVEVKYVTAGDQTSYTVIPLQSYVAVLTGNDTYTCLVDFKFPAGGIVEMTASAMDTHHLNSKITTFTVEVAPQTGPGGGGGPPPIDYSWIAPVAIIMIILGLILAIAPIPVPSFLKTIGWIILLIGIVILVIYGMIAFKLVTVASTIQAFQGGLTR